MSPGSTPTGGRVMILTAYCVLVLRSVASFTIANPVWGMLYQHNTSSNRSRSDTHESAQDQESKGNMPCCCPADCCFARAQIALHAVMRCAIMPAQRHSCRTHNELPLHAAPLHAPPPPLRHAPPAPSVLPSLYASLILQSVRFLDTLQISTCACRGKDRAPSAHSMCFTAGWPHEGASGCCCCCCRRHAECV